MKFPVLISFIAFLSIQAVGQTCINKYAAVKFTGTTYDTFTTSITTAGNEIITAGQLYDYNSAGHIARYTEKGTPIWSYTYKLDYFDFVKAVFFKAVNISDMLPTADGGVIVAGNVEQVLSPYGLPPPVKNWALMSKLDRFGKVEWTKTVSNQGGDLSFTNFYETSDGDLIAYLAIDNGQKKTYLDHSYGRVIRMNSKGVEKWSSLLYTFLFDAGGLGIKNKRAIMQAKNGNIIIGDVVHKSGNTFLETKEGNLHFLELDYAAGNVNWETSYEYPVPVSDHFYSPDLLQVIALQDGFSFTSNLYLSAGPGQPLLKKPVTINTNAKGVIQSINAYVPSDGTASRVMQATIDKTNGNRTLLIENDGKARLMQLDNNGQLLWQKGYQTTSGAFPPNCFSAGKKGFNIFMSNNRTKQYRLLVTDQQGAIDCFNEPAGVSVVPAVLNLGHDSVVTKTNYNLDSYYDYAYPLKRDEDYPVEKLTECQQTLSCCTDFIDRSNVPDIHICAGTDYTLPDGTLVSDSGMYNVTYKTAGGCDSIRYYKITVDKDVKDLTLGNDTCLTGSNSFNLIATPGYQKYFWMKNDVATGAVYKVSHPGVYEVMVQNACGIKVDSIEIFELCDYPLYMPNAFTPNGDGINDVFRVPPLNKNNLTRLTVYNRWGQVYFQTKDPAMGWNGRYKHQEAEGGVYIYYLEMTGLSGHRLVEKGTVMLIR